MFFTERQQVWWREISSFSVFDLLSVTFTYLLMQSYLLFLTNPFIIYHIHEHNQTPKTLSHYPIVKQLLWQLKQPKPSSYQVYTILQASRVVKACVFYYSYQWYISWATELQFEVLINPLVCYFWLINKFCGKNKRQN